MSDISEIINATESYIASMKTLGGDWVCVDLMQRLLDMVKEMEWQPIYTIPHETMVYLRNDKGEIDTGKWCDYTDKYGFDETKDLHGEISSVHGFGDYTYWKFISYPLKQG